MFPMFAVTRGSKSHESHSSTDARAFARMRAREIGDDSNAKEPMAGWHRFWPVGQEILESGMGGKWTLALAAKPSDRVNECPK